MDRILDQLRAKAGVAPHAALLLSETIYLLTDIHRRPDGPHLVSWDALDRKFQQLRDCGLWERSTENDELLESLRILLTSPSGKAAENPPLAENISIIDPSGPSQNLPPGLVSNQDHLVLPVELIDILNNAYFLHVLATDPAQVLPPGKSLLSVMSRTHNDTTVDGDTKAMLHNKVGDLVHKAFWEEVRTLPLPSPAYD